MGRIIRVPPLRPVSFPVTGSPAYGVGSVLFGGTSGPNPLAQTASGLLYRDDFATLDLNYWEKQGAGTSSIVGGQWRGISSATITLQGASAPAARTVAYAQVLMTRVAGSDSGMAFWLRKNADVDGYYIGCRASDTQLWRVLNSSYALIDQALSHDTDLGVQYRYNFYVADSKQTVWRDGGATGLDQTSGSLNGQTGVPSIWSRHDTTAGDTGDADNFIYMAGGNMVCTGLDTGQKFKILAGESVVKTATESGGTATINWLDGTLVPFDGWATAIVTDGSDAERYRLSGAHYPGGTYELSL